MEIIELSNIINNIFNYKSINENSSIKLRNIEGGITLLDALYYKLLYTSINFTKEEATSKINEDNDKSFNRGSYESKENNIPLNVYQKLFNQIILLYNKTLSKNSVKIISMDGTYNRDQNYNEVMNMGFFDSSNAIPIALKSYGVNGKNNEIKSAMNFIKDNLDYFKETILIGDRIYFCYEFLDFLINNNLKFIIRVKGEATNLDPNVIVKKGIKDYNKIIDIKKNVRVIKYQSVYEKIVYSRINKKNKKNIKAKKYILTYKNDCNLVTNLLDDKIYDNKKCLDLYKLRWDVEVYSF